MKSWLNRTALSVVVSGLLPLVGFASPAVGHAEPPPPPCPPGMYWNFVTVMCEWPAPTVYIDPYLPVWIPDVIDADLDIDIPIPGPPGIGGPGGPGGPGVGRPGPPPPRPAPRGGGGRGGRR